MTLTLLTINSRTFIEERMGRKYVEGENIDFYQSYQESGPSTPIFFILSPGVDPLKVGELCDTYLHNIHYTIYNYMKLRSNHGSSSDVYFLSPYIL